MKDYISFCRRLATARDMISAKHSSTGQGRTTPKAPMNFKNREEQRNPNGSRKEGGRTYCGRGSSGGVLRNSGANRSMQRPTVKQRRGLAMMAVLRCEDVARKKKGERRAEGR